MQKKGNASQFNMERRRLISWQKVAGLLANMDTFPPSPCPPPQLKIFHCLPAYWRSWPCSQPPWGVLPPPSILTLHPTWPVGQWWWDLKMVKRQLEANTSSTSWAGSSIITTFPEISTLVSTNKANQGFPVYRVIFMQGQQANCGRCSLDFFI